MKIKKVYQGEIPSNIVVNSYSESGTDTYSCNYINSRIIKKRNITNPLTKSRTSLTDNDLKIAEYVIVYYTFGYGDADGYKCSMVVYPDGENWFEMSTTPTRTSDRGFVKINATTGTMTTSAYSAAKFAIVGYDIILK